MKKATVAICTAGRRSDMLKRCIQSLRDAYVVDVYGWDVDILLVMNMEQPLEKQWPYVNYIHEPKMGLSTARNVAIKYCLDNDREWLIFIDDDTWVSADWLENFVIEQEGREDINIFQGHVSYLKTGCEKTGCFHYGKDHPWIKEPKRPKHGSSMRVACTNNAMINLSICKDGLRFDEAYNQTGGEDTDFFLRARKGGAEIKYLSNVKIYEELPKERQTLKGYLWRGYWCASVNMYSSIRREGVIAVFKKAPKLITRMVIGLAMILLSPLTIVRGKKAALLMAIKGINKLTFVVGSIVGLTPWRPLPYKFKKDKAAI